jgi:hypothetical protein
MMVRRSVDVLAQLILTKINVEISPL